MNTFFMTPPFGEEWKSYTGGVLAEGKSATGSAIP
jgi:hypothetical protein